MMHIVDILQSKFKQYSLVITVVIVFILFSGMSYYLYTQFTKTQNSSINKFKDVANSGDNNKELNVLMFHVDWCPHCKKALPDWVAFCNEYNNKVVNNYKITCNKEGTNCTDDDSSEIKKLIAEYNIVSYPTVVLIKDNKRYDFDAKITKHTLEQFINSVSM
jgi:thiol-disulfide isomerase/thioredoxin